MMNFVNTIVAISTALSNSGIGIVRLSGENAIEIADKVFKSKTDKKLVNQKSHTIHYGFVVDNDDINNDIIDEVLVMLMKAPHSFTKEDTVEFNCHGGVYVVKKVLSSLIKAGATPATPGEFTKRAFLNGRMDLSQAEAVSDLIYSQNDYALRSSISQLKGSLKTKIETIRNEIMYYTAYIESALDDPEHISLDDFGTEIAPKLSEWSHTLKELADSANSGKIIKEGINTVILGKPNAGKSSLLNVLLDEDRAIVTDIAGTTRDALEEHINLGEIALNIIDTAGIRNTEDTVEKIGVSKAKEYANNADLILYVIDSSNELDENDEQIVSMITDKKSIVLLNKSDLDMKVGKNDVESYIKKKAPEFKPIVIEISAKNNKGITEIKETIKELFFAGNISFNDEIYITNARQASEIEQSYLSVGRVQTSLTEGMPEDFLTIDLLDAYEHLGNITGETIGEDLVNEIFSKFCMGK
ncbi:MAG: tRNA uridine-5-carboxymethylaminomethyl(34) synthesis GTPase MnmE [Suipraeoptans sp.]